MLVTVSAVGLFVLQAVNERSYSGNWGTTAGRGFDVYNIPLDPGRGSYVRFEVTSTDGGALDVYFTDQDGLRAARSDDPFDFDAQRSALNTTHVAREVRLSEYSQIVVMSHDPSHEVKIRSSALQSPYPLDLMPVLQAAGLACLAVNLGVAVMLLHSWARGRAGRH
jgi:hypothetical protein